MGVAFFLGKGLLGLGSISEVRLGAGVMVVVMVMERLYTCMCCIVHIYIGTQ